MARQSAIIDRLLYGLIAVPVAIFTITSSTALVWYWLGVPPEQSQRWLVALMVILAGTVTFVALRSQGAQNSDFNRTEGEALDQIVGSALSIACALAITTIFAFPVLFATYWMGSGDYPEVFFNVDSAFYLSHVQTLSRSELYPPPSLNTLGVAVPYHYGVQLFAALLTRFEVVPAHTALFWIAIPAFFVGILAIVWRFARLAARQGVPMWVSVLCLLFLVQLPAAELVDDVVRRIYYDPEIAVDTLNEITFQVGEYFSTGFPQLTALSGNFATLVIGLAIIDRVMPFRYTAIALSCGALPLFKSVYIVPVGIWIGLLALFAVLRDRQLKLLFSSAAALIIAIALSPSSVRGGHAFALSFDPFSHGIEWQKDIFYRSYYDYGGLWLVSAIAISLICVGKYDFASFRRSTSIPMSVAGLVVLFIPVFVFVSYTNAMGQTVELLETRQWYLPTRWIPSMALVAALIEFWRVQAPSGWTLVVRTLVVRSLVVGIIVIFSSLPLIAWLYGTTVLLTRSSDWHDFADNRAIASALATIPVKGSIIATNDLHYPRKFSKQDRRQYQIAALFGHQAYGADYLIDLPADADERARKQEELAGGIWTPIHSQFSCEKRWTHLLLSARVGFATNVPGKLIHESSDYKVYELPECSSRQ